MAHGVTFDDKVRVRQSGRDYYERLNDATSMPLGVAILAAVGFVACFAVWVAGLVVMGKSHGRESWLFWCTIFFPIFIPVFGQAWGVVVGIIALVALRPGGHLLGMHNDKVRKN